MAENKYVFVDCDKARAKLDSAGDKNLKQSGLTHQAKLRIVGKDQHPSRPFARVEYKNLQKFAEFVGCKPEDLQVNFNEYDKWRRQRANQKREDDVPNNLKRPHKAVRILHPFDFSGRTKDRSQLEVCFDRLKGYYEGYHYGMSLIERNDLSIFLLHVKKIDYELSIIECEIHDWNERGEYFHEFGHIIPLGNFLYFFFVAKHGDALSFFLTHRPGGESRNFTIHGIKFGLAGGVGGAPYRCPSAARLALRYIGVSAKDALVNCIRDVKGVPTKAHEWLCKNIGGYLSELVEDKIPLRPRILSLIETKIKPKISNRIDPRTVPFALTMPSIEAPRDR